MVGSGGSDRKHLISTTGHEALLNLGLRFREYATPLTRETFGLVETVTLFPKSPICSLRIQGTSRRRFRLSRTSRWDRSSSSTDVGSADAMPRCTMPSCDKNSITGNLLSFEFLAAVVRQCLPVALPLDGRVDLSKKRRRAIWERNDEISASTPVCGYRRSCCDRGAPAHLRTDHRFKPDRGSEEGTREDGLRSARAGEP